MTLEQLLTELKQFSAALSFADVISTIEANYHYMPQSFDNGIGEDCVHNPAGTNEGSCKVFAFGQLQNLSTEQTLACFAEHYHKVLATPDGTDHANIRTFIRHGWAGIKFLGNESALRLKSFN